mgnify:CR=1 FL=1
MEHAVSLLHSSFPLQKNPLLLISSTKPITRITITRANGALLMNFFHIILLFSLSIPVMSAELSTTIKYVRQIKKDSCISIIRRCILHKLLIDIHESHYLRFARLYSLIIIRMLTNHTFALTTPSWNIKLLDKYYQM